MNIRSGLHLWSDITAGDLLRTELVLGEGAPELVDALLGLLAGARPGALVHFVVLAGQAEVGEPAHLFLVVSTAVLFIEDETAIRRCTESTRINILHAQGTFSVIERTTKREAQAHQRDDLLQESILHGYCMSLLLAGGVRLTCWLVLYGLSAEFIVEVDPPSVAVAEQRVLLDVGLHLAGVGALDSVQLG